MRRLFFWKVCFIPVTLMSAEVRPLQVCADSETLLIRSQRSEVKVMGTYCPHELNL